MKSTKTYRVHHLYKALSTVKDMVRKICGFLSEQTYHFIK